MKIRDRIKELRRVPAAELLPNPRNWRRHPERQHNALRSLLAEVGIADAVLARETEHGLQLIDGHLRAEVASDCMLPVLVLDVTEAEADILLASLDPLAGWAEVDAAALEDLAAGIELDAPDVSALWEELTGGKPAVLGDDDVVEKDQRAGSSPWSRVEASDRVRVLIGDVEFGVEREAAERFVEWLKQQDAPMREAAEAWLTKQLLQL